MSHPTDMRFRIDDGELGLQACREAAAVHDNSAAGEVQTVRPDTDGLASGVHHVRPRADGLAEIRCLTVLA